MAKTLLLALLALLLISCSKGNVSSGRESDVGQSRAAVLARVGRVELRAADLERAIARDPGASAQRFDGPQARRELLEGLVRFELLVQAADRAGYTKDPDAIHALQQIAVTKLVNHTLGAAGAPETISQADVQREYYARKASDFTLPEAAQVRHILVSDLELAKRTLAQARALTPGDDQAFVALVASRSEDPATRSTGGDLGYIDKNSRLPAALIEAALNLRAPGDIAGPIPTAAGYELLRLVGRRAGAVSPFSSVEGILRQRLYQERRGKALEALIAKLRTETPVEFVDGGAVPQRRIATGGRGR